MEDKKKLPNKTINQLIKDIKRHEKIISDPRKTGLRLNPIRKSNDYEVINVGIDPKTQRIALIGNIKIFEIKTKFTKDSKYSILFFISECSDNLSGVYENMAEAIMENKNEYKNFDKNKDSTFGKKENELSLFLGPNVLFNFDFSDDKFLTFTSDILLKKWEKNTQVLKQFFDETMLYITMNPGKITIKDNINKSSDVVVKLSFTNYKCRLESYEDDVYNRLKSIFEDKKSSTSSSEDNYYKKKKKEKRKEKKSKRKSRKSDTEESTEETSDE